MQKRRVVWPLRMALWVIVGVACGGGDATRPATPENDPPPVTPVARVEVSVPATLQAGEAAQATANLYSSSGVPLLGRAITWSTGNGEIATVSQSGLLTAVAVGTTTITATAEGRSGSASLTVTPVPVATIDLSVSAPWFLTGDRERIVAQARGANGAFVTAPITWSSSDSTVARVEADGTINAISTGFAAITARSGVAQSSLSIRVFAGGGTRWSAARALDSAMIALRDARGMVGTSIAVMVNGQLVYTRGFGWADSLQHRTVNAGTAFRMFSISKTVTASGILRAMDLGLLHLSDSAFVIRSDLTTLPGMTEDPRTRGITIAHLLYFASGILYGYPEPINDCWRSGSLDREEAVRCIRGLPLAASPGAQANYTNNGALVLARVLERVSGRSYPTFITEEVLVPGGVTGMNLQRARLSDRPPNETMVYPTDWAATYGTDRGLDGFDATGGWVAAPSTVLRFLRAYTGGGSQATVLSPSSRALLETHPAMGAIAPGATVWLGPLFYPFIEGSSRRFEGIGQGSDGGCMYFSHNPAGVSFVFATNTVVPAGEDCWVYGGLIKPFVLGVTSWPTGDLFTTTQSSRSSASPTAARAPDTR